MATTKTDTRADLLPAIDEELRRKPIFRRAKPDDALELALSTFNEGVRVDMQALAIQLDVSRATLHRWFGSREQLLDRVCEQLALAFTGIAREQAQGDGDERVCDYARRIMEMAIAHEPTRMFVTREPQLALRLILGQGGAVHRTLTAGLRGITEESRPADEVRAMDKHIHVIVQVSTALVWGTFVVGDEPQIDSAVEIIRMTLAGDREGSA